MGVTIEAWSVDLETCSFEMVDIVIVSERLALFETKSRFSDFGESDTVKCVDLEFVSKEFVTG